MGFRMIHKYSLDKALTDGGVTLMIPPSATVIHCHASYRSTTELPTIWVEFDQSEKAVKRKFIIVGTGMSIAIPAAKHVGTCHCREFVWHVYEVPDEG